MATPYRPRCAPSKRTYLRRLRLQTLETRLVPATFTVTNTAAFGAGSFTQAIVDSNGTVGHDVIEFNIPGSGVQTINSLLPDITDGVTIDGYTQPGAKANTLSVGSDAVLLIELEGTGLGFNAGLELINGGSLIRGLVINRFGKDGIEIHGGGNTIAGNYIGTDPTGTQYLPNGRHGIFAWPRFTDPIQVHSSDSNIIGGANPADRNVVTHGAFYDCVHFSLSSKNVVSGNYLGINAPGQAALSNVDGHGVAVDTYNGSLGVGPAEQNTIGGDVTGAGNVISGNGRLGIYLNGPLTVLNTVVQGNFIGTDANGLAAVPNLWGGILLGQSGTAAGTLIGGPTPGARNIISGNGIINAAITLGNGEAGTTNNTIQGNYIGTEKTGSVAIPNLQLGIEVKSPGNSVIGNVISGNGGTGIHVRGGDGSVIQGNFIGTNAAGTAAIPNSTSSGDGGLTLSTSQSCKVGGTTPSERNVISGNKGVGVFLDSTVSKNAIQGNFIGLDVSGSPLGNTLDGVYIGTGPQAAPDGDRIGGTAPGAGNVIANNGRYGVALISGSGLFVEGNSIYANGGDGVIVGGGGGKRDRVSQNSIHDNGKLGINLYYYFDGLTGVTVNDPGDADEGVYGNEGNRLQNYPVINSVTRGGSTTNVTGTLNSMANLSFTIEFFANTALDPSGYGEGERYLGSTTVTTDGSGNASFNATLSAITEAGEYVTATATDPDGNTSEFSLNSQAVGAPTVSSVVVNAGAAQRSRVTSLAVTFDSAVTLPTNPADAFQLKRQSDNALVSLVASVSGNTVTLTFTGGPTEFGSLADGRFTLKVLASQVPGLDGDGNGTAGDDYVLIGDPAESHHLFRLFGDADGNGIVDGVDFGAFRSAFNTNSGIFDFDGSGVVDGLDFGQFRQRFGVAI